MDHAPGPWKVVRLGDGSERYRIGYISDAKGRRVTAFVGRASTVRFDPEIYEGNARLIAAAPEMLYFVRLAKSCPCPGRSECSNAGPTPSDRNLCDGCGARVLLAKIDGTD